MSVKELIINELLQGPKTRSQLSKTIRKEVPAFAKDLKHPTRQNGLIDIGLVEEVGGRRGKQGVLDKLKAGKNKRRKPGKPPRKLKIVESFDVLRKLWYTYPELRESIVLHDGLMLYYPDLVVDYLEEHLREFSVEERESMRGCVGRIKPLPSLYSIGLVLVILVQNMKLGDFGGVFEPCKNLPEDLTQLADPVFVNAIGCPTAMQVGDLYSRPDIH